MSSAEARASGVFFERRHHALSDTIPINHRWRKRPPLLVAFTGHLPAGRRNASASRWERPIHRPTAATRSFATTPSSASASCPASAGQPKVAAWRSERPWKHNGHRPGGASPEGGRAPSHADVRVGLGRPPRKVCDYFADSIPTRNEWIAAARGMRGPRQVVLVVLAGRDRSIASPSRPHRQNAISEAAMTTPVRLSAADVRSCSTSTGVVGIGPHRRSQTNAVGEQGAGDQGSSSAREDETPERILCRCYRNSMPEGLSRGSQERRTPGFARRKDAGLGLYVEGRPSGSPTFWFDAAAKGRTSDRSAYVASILARVPGGVRPGDPLHGQYGGASCWGAGRRLR